MTNAIEIPQFNLQAQDLTRPFRLTDTLGNEFNIRFHPSGGFTINKHAAGTNQINILPMVQNEIHIF